MQKIHCWVRNGGKETRQKLLWRSKQQLAKTCGGQGWVQITVASYRRAVSRQLSERLSACFRVFRVRPREKFGHRSVHAGGLWTNHQRCQPSQAALGPLRRLASGFSQEIKINWADLKVVFQFVWRSRGSIRRKTKHRKIGGLASGRQAERSAERLDLQEGQLSSQRQGQRRWIQVCLFEQGGLEKLKMFLLAIIGSGVATGLRKTNGI